MDNKQIIIDGVNIKDCKRRIGKDNYCRYYKRPCSENNFNCIWKKYLRKEQECEAFKNCLINIKEIAEENIRIADLEGLNGVYRRGLAEQILQKISECEVE